MPRSRRDTRSPAVIVETYTGAGRRRQKYLWQKDSGFACQTAIFFAADLFAMFFT
jgi:hypothetical protein